MDCQITPAVWIDMDTVEKNIGDAVKNLGAYGISHRPHVKVHKNVKLAKLQQHLGCRGITCAKLGEAEVMADGGITDILVAYPLIGRENLKRYRRLIERGIQIRTVVNSIPGAKGLSRLGEEMGTRLSVLVELDGGIGRGGVKLGEPLKEFGEALRDFKGIKVEGVESYSGDIYGCRTAEEIRLRARRERDEIVESADTLRKLGFDMKVLSGGSSFSLLFPEELEGLTEVRAGNYIFNDNALFSIGMISLERCAMRVHTMVVARPDEYTAIIDAGSKTLSSDHVNFREGYGYIPEMPEAVIEKLNEEHGYVRSNKGIDWGIGQIITVIPNHACTVPNLCGEMYGMRGGSFGESLCVDARGCNR